MRKVWILKDRNKLIENIIKNTFNLRKAKNLTEKLEKNFKKLINTKNIIIFIIIRFAVIMVKP